jgi:hypothetical protein
LAAPNSRPSKSAVRAALLSARLYHDTLESNSLLRYAGFGVLDRGRALEILQGDAEQPDPYVPWLSLARLTRAYNCLPADQKDASANDVAAMEQGLLDLLSVSPPPDPRAAALLAGVNCKDRAPLMNARNWKTTVTRRGEVTEVVSEMEILADFNRVALMCDPRQWENVSLFWYESTPVEGGPEGPTPSIDNPTAKPEPWTGKLREKVAGMGIMTVELKVDYQVGETSCRVDYGFVRSPDSQLSVDDGWMTVTKMNDGWLKSKVLKKIDFLDAPFGGPSSADLLAPSFIATWMRVQQDFWAARATDWQRSTPSASP